MSDIVKLIIEIPKDIYERCKEYKLWSYDAETLEGAVATSKPLSESVDEIKAKYDSIPWRNNEYDDGWIEALEWVLGIFEKSTES